MKNLHDLALFFFPSDLVLSDLPWRPFKQHWRALWENYISAASLPGSGGQVFKDKKTVEESE